jgi:hypothetical protein
MQKLIAIALAAFLRRKWSLSGVKRTSKTIRRSTGVLAIPTDLQKNQIFLASRELRRGGHSVGFA